MIKRRGRPKSVLTKSDRLEIRLSKEQSYWLRCIMNKTEKTKSQIVIEAIKMMYESNK